MYVIVIIFILGILIPIITPLISITLRASCCRLLYSVIIVLVSYLAYY